MKTERIEIDQRNAVEVSTWSDGTISLTVEAAESCTHMALTLDQARAVAALLIRATGSLKP